MMAAQGERHEQQRQHKQSAGESYRRLPKLSHW